MTSVSVHWVGSKQVLRDYLHNPTYIYIGRQWACRMHARRLKRSEFAPGSMSTNMLVRMFEALCLQVMAL